MSLKNIWSAIKKHLGRLLFASLLSITSIAYVFIGLNFVFGTAAETELTVVYSIFFIGLPLALLLLPIWLWWTVKWGIALRGIGWLFVSPAIFQLAMVIDHLKGFWACLLFFAIKAVLLLLRIRKSKRDGKPIRELFFKPSHKDVVCTHAAKPSTIYFP
jgi:hypothetical protein